MSQHHAPASEESNVDASVDSAPATRRTRNPLPPHLGHSPSLNLSFSQQLALVAMFAALICVCAVMPSITIGAIPAPITLQTFGVMVTGMILGPRLGPLAVALYLAVGALGLPVFSRGASGLAVFTGPTAGYLLSFPLLAFAVALVMRWIRGASFSLPLATTPARTGALTRARAALLNLPITGLIIVGCVFASYLTTHLLGIAGMVARVPMPARDAFVADLVFVPGDIVKTSAATLVALAVLRGFPRLSTSRSSAPLMLPAQ